MSYKCKVLFAITAAAIWLSSTVITATVVLVILSLCEVIKATVGHILLDCAAILAILIPTLIISYNALKKAEAAQAAKMGADQKKQ